MVSRRINYLVKFNNLTMIMATKNANNLSKRKMKKGRHTHAAKELRINEAMTQQPVKVEAVRVA